VKRTTTSTSSSAFAPTERRFELVWIHLGDQRSARLIGALPSEERNGFRPLRNADIAVDVEDLQLSE
jgi:hypothetical protein